VIFDHNQNQKVQEEAKTAEFTNFFILAVLISQLWMV
jgi:hypothetical protein